MILADKIMDERKKNGWSQEELAEKIGVSRQSVSKWESAQSTPDLQRVLQLAELFGVSTDYLLKEELETAAPATASSAESYGEDGQEIRRVSMDEAHEFLSMQKANARQIANGVSLCILSPVILILLSGFAESGIGRISENLAAGIGIVVLLVMVAAAVFGFVTCGIRAGRMEYLEQEIFETEYGVRGMVRERRDAHEPEYTRSIAIGVVLCIVSAIPLIIAGVLEAPDHLAVAGVCLLLVLVAAAVNMIVRTSIVRGSFDTLLQEGEYTGSEKRAKKKLEHVSGIYWALALAAYLGWSFASGSWETTWIVWPVAAVAYAAIEGIARLVMKTD